jgi:hypothetical protein
VLILGLGGCGFIAAGKASDTKPSGFVLRGTVRVAGAAAGAVGSQCVAPDSVPEVYQGVPVNITDGNVQDSPHTLASGVLGTGKLAPDNASTTGYTCEFPLVIYNVPAGPASYGIAVGELPPAPFEAEPLRHDEVAVIDLGPTKLR